MNGQNLPKRPQAVNDSRQMLQIGPDRYQVRRLEPDPAVAKVAFRLEKETGTGGDLVIYDVRMPSWPENLPADYAECDCRRFVTHGHCKHVDALRHAGLLQAVRQVPLENWRRVWREGIAPFLSVAGLEALKKALESDDPALLQGMTCSPPPLQCCSDLKCEGGCGVAYAVWKGWEACRLDTVGEVEEKFALVCLYADRQLGEPAAARWFLNWFDETPRPKMRLLLLAEVRRELGRRKARSAEIAVDHENDPCSGANWPPTAA